MGHLLVENKSTRTRFRNEWHGQDTKSKTLLLNPFHDGTEFACASEHTTADRLKDLKIGYRKTIENGYKINWHYINTLRIHE